MSWKILYVGNHAGHFVSHRLPLAIIARKHGYEVSVAIPPGDGFETVQEAGFTVYPFWLSRQGINPLMEMQTLISLIRIIRQVNPDLIHNFTIKPSIYGGLAGRFFPSQVLSSITGVGQVFSNEDLFTIGLRQLLKWGFIISIGAPGQHVIVQNEANKQIFQQNNIVSKSNLHLIKGSGVDMTQFVPRPFPDAKTTVTLASRMIWQKGVRVFVDAARHLLQSGVDAQFWLVGDSDENLRGSISRSQLQAWHDEGVVNWMGYQEDIMDIYARSHIICLPSTYGEGVPKALIEAAAMSRPIVTTYNPGCRDLVTHEVNGLLVQPQDVDELRNALQTLISQPHLWEQYGKAGRAIVEEEYSLQYVASAIIDLYQQLVTTKV